MQERQRHILLTIWLVVIIGANLIEASRQIFLHQELAEMYPQAPEWVFTGLILVALAKVACAVALFLWKKWGFWGFLLFSLAGVLLYFQLGMGLPSLLLLLPVAILYGLLQLGGENKAWLQLE